MNLENLKLAYEHMKTIDPSHFDISIYRKSGERSKYTCNSIGCIIGHCTILVPYESLPIIDSPFRHGEIGDINFTKWSEDFFGVKSFSEEWCFVFDSEWGDSEYTKTLEQALKRMEYVLANDGQVPHGWGADYSWTMD